MSAQPLSPQPDPTQHPDTSSPPVAAVVVLAAGAGTRMKSRLPKVMHPIAGRPLVWHAIRAAAALGPADLVTVVGHGREVVTEFITRELPDVRLAVQDEQLGTGHAVACGLAGASAPAGIVLVTYGDVPLLTADSLRELAAEHARSANAVTVLTARVSDPTGYGRIVRDGSGALTGIVEHKDATEAQRGIDEINSGVYAFDGTFLTEALPRIKAANAQGEQYLTDLVSFAALDGLSLGTVQATDPVEIEGVNDRVQLAELAAELNRKLVRKAQRSGVTVLDPSTTWIHADVQIGRDTVIAPGTSLEAGTVIGEDCRIGPDTTLSGCTVEDGASVVRSHCFGARIGAGASVGPFTYLRPGAVLLAGAKAGAFVEIKSSTVGEGSKVPHLSYVGDATIGSGVNIGAGTITANYDGVNKFPTVVGDNSFVGTNSTLVAPATIAPGAYVAAGSTITDEVGPGELAVARGRQAALPGWVLRKRAGTKTAVSAAAAGAIDPRASEPDNTPADGKELQA